MLGLGLTCLLYILVEKLQRLLGYESGTEERIWAGGVNFEFFSIWMVFKVMRLVETTKGLNVSRVEVQVTEFWDLQH